MKLTRHEKESIERQMKSEPIRDKSWVGIRPHIFKDKSKDKKSIRQSNKRLIKKELEDE